MVKGKIALVMLGAVGLALIPIMGQASSGGEWVGGHRAWTAPQSISLFSHEPQTSHGLGVPNSKPFLRPAGLRAKPMTQAPVASLTSPQSSGPFLTQVSTFPMMSFDVQVAALGALQAVEPPDTMMAAGP